MTTDYFQPHEIFISYSRDDDEPVRPGESGWVSALRDEILADHRRFSTEPLRVFFDTSDIQPMDDLRHEILDGLRHSHILLNCLSPRYLNSDYCWLEWEEYQLRQTHYSVGQDTIATVYLEDVPGGETYDNASRVDEWLKQINRALYAADLRTWFSQGPMALRDPAVQKQIEALGNSLWERIRRARQADGVPGNLRRRNPYFVGRRNELDDLHEKVSLGAIGVVTAVHGLGGQGKTELATAYAHIWSYCYPGGVWVLSAEGWPKLLPLLGQLSDELDLPVSVNPKESASDRGRRVLHELKRRTLESRCRDPKGHAACLLLLDNATEPELLSEPQLAEIPREDWLHVVVTTRQKPGEIPGRLMPSMAFVPVDRLLDEDALKLILAHQPVRSTTGQPIRNPTSQQLSKPRQFASDQEEAAAREIVRELGGFALAVEQVALYLGLHPDVQPSAYLARLRREGLVGSDVLGTDPEVANQIRHREKQIALIVDTTLEGLDAPVLAALEYAALLPPDHIQWPLLREMIEKEYPDVLDRETGYPDPWIGVRRRLEGLRLITPGDGEQNGRIHCMVAAHIFHRLTRDRKANIAFSLLPAYYLLMADRQSTSGYDKDDISCFMFWHAFTPYILALLQSLPDEDSDRAAVDFLLASKLSNDMGVHLNVSRRFEDAKNILSRSLKWAQKSSMEAEVEAAALASRYNNLAQSYDELGRTDDAINAMESALDFDRKFDDRLHIAMSLTNLGTYKKSAGLVREAYSHFLEAREILQDCTAATGFHRGFLEESIASLLRLCGRPSEAWTTCCRAIKEMEDDNYTGTDYSRVLRNATDLAIVLGKKSKAAAYCAKALYADMPRMFAYGSSWMRDCRLLVRVADVFEYHDQHVTRLSELINNLSDELAAPIADPNSRIDLQRKILDSMDRVTAILSSLYLMIMDHDDLEDTGVEDAGVVAEVTTKLDEKFFGKDSKKYASDLVNQGGVCVRTGALLEAKKLLAMAIEIDGKYLDDTEYAFDRGKTRMNMAFVLDALGEPGEAKGHAEEALRLIPTHRIYGLADEIARLERLAGRSTWGSSRIGKTRKIGRNALCPCGSGKKYKKCCLRHPR